MSDDKKQKSYEIPGEDLMNVIIKVPKNTACADIVIHFFDENSKPQKAVSHMSAEMIRDARKDFLDNVDAGDDYDVTYAVTEKGREWLAKIAAGDSQALSELDEIARMVEEGE